MSQEEVVNRVRSALAVKFPKAEIVTDEEHFSPLITVIDEEVTFDVEVHLGEEWLVDCT